MPNAAAFPITWRTRLRAWWDGYDLDALYEEAVKAQPAEAPPPPVAPLPTRLESRTDAPDPVLPKPCWDADRLTAAQLVWGEGAIGPSGEGQLQEIARERRLTSSSAVVHLGAELGATAERIRRGTGCRVLPLDTLDLMAEASGGRVSRLGEAPIPAAGTVDLVLMDHIAERGEPLSQIVRDQGRILKREGRMVIRTLVLSAAGGDRRQGDGSALEAWRAEEPCTPRLRTVAELRRIVENAGLRVERDRSKTDTYVAEIETAWRTSIDTIRLLSARGNMETVGARLIAEGERWLARVTLLESGVMDYRELVAMPERRGR
ncbi:MAG: hypothetical protein AAF205_14000 [Pseudomonadota bacterium]